MLRGVLAPLLVLVACHSVPEPVGDAAASAAPRPEPALGGALELKQVGSLGVGGRQIAFLSEDRWVSSAGYQVTAWEGLVPANTFHLDAYNYLAVSTDHLRVFGDREAIVRTVRTVARAIGSKARIS